MTIQPHYTDAILIGLAIGAMINLLAWTALAVYAYRLHIKWMKP